MTATAYEPGSAEFRAGRVIVQSLSVFFRNIVSFGLFALFLTSPSFVFSLLFGAPENARVADSEGVAAVRGLLALVDLLLGYLIMAALVYGTVQDLRGEKVGIGECFSQGFRRMFPVLGVAILSGILTGLATLALVIPGIIVAIMLWVTIPVAVMERRGVGSLARSSELTKGHRWSIFFVLVVVTVILIGLVLVFGAGFGIVMAIVGNTDLGGNAMLAVDWVVGALVYTLFAVVYAVTYHDLRVAKEGLDTNQIASVFD
jgi:membrane-anchored glycerophosphoryl diester phosphodiesterase (GDPDase)